MRDESPSSLILSSITLSSTSLPYIRFSLMVPEKSTESCGITDTALRREEKEAFLIS